MLAEYDHEMATTRKVLERVPEERLTWRPHERSMTLGGLAQHVANIPNWSTAILDDVTFELTSSPLHLAEPASHAAIMALFLASTAKARRALDKADVDAQAKRPRGVHDATDRGVPDLRRQPHRSPPGAAERLPETERRRRTGHLRSLGRRRVDEAHPQSSTWILSSPAHRFEMAIG